MLHLSQPLYLILLGIFLYTKNTDGNLYSFAHFTNSTIYIA